MDRELGVLDGRHHNDLHEVAGSVRPDDEPTVGIFACVFDSDRIVDGVMDVLVNDIVLTRRVVNLNTRSVLRKDGNPDHCSWSSNGRLAAREPDRGRCREPLVQIAPQLREERRFRVT